MHIHPAVDPKWIRNASDGLAVKQGCWFDESAGLFVIEFIEEFCRQSQGRWAGQPLILLEWQRDFLMRLFGWKRPDGLRRFKRAYLEVAKKNGKSTMISALCLVLLLIDLKGSPQVFLNACDKEQASIVFDEAKRMVEKSPELAKRLDVIDSRKTIVHAAGDGKIVANSAEVDKQDGLNPSGIVFDELHRQKTRRLWDIFEYAAVAREQPLTIAITTAGETEEGIWWDQREYSEKVLAGVIPDTTHLGVIYRALATDDIDDPATWRKANPSLGHTIKEEDFARMLAEAKLDPAKLANFKRLRLNIVCRGETQFVDLTVWDLGNVPVIIIPGAPAYAGLDLSETQDLSALAILFEDDEWIDVIMHFWLPEANILELERRHNMPYRAWADLKLITLTPGNVIDYGFVRKQVNDLAGDHDLVKLLVDPYNASKLTIELAEQDGLPVESIRQGFLSLSSPTKQLKRLILSGRIRHGGNPILRYHASNAVCVSDAAGNIKLSKAKSQKKIDGMAALVNAVAAWDAGDGDGGPSVYEERGSLFPLIDPITSKGFISMLYPSFIYSLKANQLFGSVVEAADFLTECDASVRNAYIAAGQGVGVDLIPDADLSQAGYANSAAVVFTFTGTTAITLDLTDLVAATGVAVAGAGTFAGSFATWGTMFFQNVGASAKSVAISPGASDPIRSQISGTSPVMTLLGGDSLLWTNAIGLVVDSTHKEITFTPASAGSMLLYIGGS